MYKEYFNLREQPFSIAPDPRYLYMSEQHREALAHLVYGISTDGGFVLLTGEVGAGKTTVCRCLLEQIPADTQIAFILNPRVTVEELLATLCDELGISYQGAATSNKAFIDRINEYLLDAHGRGQKTVLIIEEAQNLSPDVLEQVRLLTNLETNERKLLQIIMLGQPELRDMLARPEFRQLAQRITARYHLGPLSKEEVPAYVRHRLSVAGGRTDLFPESIFGRLYRLSGGVPRLVNLICDRALLGSFVQGRNQVDKTTLIKAAKEVFGEIPGAGGRKSLGWIVAGLALIAGGAALAASYYVRSYKPPEMMISAGILSSSGSVAASQKRGELVRPAELSVQQSKDAAFSALFGLWGQAYDPEGKEKACKRIEVGGMRCLDALGTLGFIRRMNRPAVLKLFDEGGREYYVALNALRGETASVRLGGEELQVNVKDIEKQWYGDYTIVWQAPPQYAGEIRPGDRGQVVQWIGQRIGTRAGEAPPAGLRYDDSLVRQVKQFQLSEGLVPDGVIGPFTLIRLQAREGSGPLLASREGNQ